MARRLCGLLAVVSVATVGTLAAAGPAGAVTVGDCTIQALTPTSVILNYRGEKSAHGQASVSCASKNYVSLEIYLYGDDPVSDDRLDPGGAFLSPAEARKIYKPVVPLRGDPVKPYIGHHCNEDKPGRDELYSKVRARLYSGPGGKPISGWTPWVKSKTVTYDCG
jgi:hypothetical protein